MEFSTATAEHSIDSGNVIEQKMMVSGNFIAACAMMCIALWSVEKKKAGSIQVSGKLPTYHLLLFSACVTVLVFCDCVILLICVAGLVAGSPSSLRDQQGHKKLVHFFSKMDNV